MERFDVFDDSAPGDGSGPVEQRGRVRDQSGRRRDTAAGQRDDHAASRDEGAEQRDHAAHRRGHRAAPTGVNTDPETVTDADLARSELAAESDRRHAHADRVAAGNDRADSAVDRQEALADRMAAARDRRQACLDGLTGTYNREAGLIQLARDVSRATRSGRQLIIAFLDVDHLKEINDSHGHAAGDRVLIAVADILQTTLRPYDLVIRYGGDEFLCAAEGIDLDAARFRFARVDQLLDKAVPGLTVTTGLAELRTGETIEAVIARADANLYHQRHKQRGHGHDGHTVPH